jgi:S-DNA-T family DNA segregation ATPase FtsK/SpoIIIE
MSAGKASASLLQRRLSIGYARAARILDILEEQGVIGPAEGAKPRDILMAKGDFHPQAQPRQNLASQNLEEQDPIAEFAVEEEMEEEKNEDNF